MNYNEQQLQEAVEKARAEGVIAGKTEMSGQIATLNTAVDEAQRVGAQAAQTRISAILGHEEAKGRDDLAKHIAFKTDMPIDAAVDLLKSSPKIEQKAGLNALMPKNPAVAADQGTAEEPDAAATVARITATAAKFRAVK